LVYAAEVVERPEQSLARTLDPTFDPRQSVILEETPAGWSPPAETPSDAPPIEARERRANFTQLGVNTPVTAILVLLDNHTPSWRATIDQQPTPIYVANHTFRAVVVPAGRHTITFTYAPTSLIVGIIISAAAGFVVLGCLFWMRTSKHRPGRY
jgi:hypothetical protein